MNTRMDYLYRDGCNYKVQNHAVLTGEFTKEDIELIKSVQDCEYFIPEQVGLPLERFDDINEDDHCWAEMDPDYDLKLTDEKPDADITWMQLMENYRKVKETGWDDAKYSPVCE